VNAVRVLALCDYYDEISTGGAEVVAREIYYRLAREHSVEVTVVGALPRKQWRPTAEASTANPRRVPVPGVDLTGLLGAQLMISPGLARAAQRTSVTLRPDVIHINGLHFHSSAVGVRLARELALPVVSTAHLGDVEAMPGLARRPASAFDRIWAGRIARGSDRVVAVSRAVRDHLADLGVDPHRIDIAYNGVDRQRFRPASSSSPSPQLRAVIVGRLTANKGPLLALEAVAAARTLGRDVRLVVVGDGPLERRARRRAEDADLAGAVHFTGRVSNVERWLMEADVALRPSYTEGLPLAVLEAMACATPVICTDVPGTLEIVGHARNGLVVPVGDVAAMSAALIRLHDDRAGLQQLSRAAAETAAAFDWSASARAHLEAFRTAVAKTPSQPPAARAAT
jgi:glycosyltransferase involved in cell wall biosynthesis